jgi:hypothetical protein
MPLVTGSPTRGTPDGSCTVKVMLVAPARVAEIARKSRRQRGIRR